MRQKRLFYIIIVVLSLFVFLSCSKKESSIENAVREGDAEKSMTDTTPALMSEPAPAAPPAEVMGGAPAKPATIPEPTVKKKKIIKTAELTIEVKNFNESLNTVRTIVKEIAPDDQIGFIADSSSSKSEEGFMTGTIVIRIMPERFDTLIEKLLPLGNVKYEHISGQDVTKEYYDLQARLVSKQEMEKRLLQLLATRTNSVADLLEVERELGRVREEIEGIQGTLRFYDDQVGMSTVNLTISEPEPIVSGSSGFWGPIKNGFKESIRGIGVSFGALEVFIGYLIPWAIVAYIVFIIVRTIIRKRRERKAQAASVVKKEK